MRKAICAIVGSSLLCLAPTNGYAQEYKEKDTGQGIRGAVGETMRKSLQKRCVDDPIYANEQSCSTFETIKTAANNMLEDAENYCSNNGLVDLNSPLGWIVNCLDAADTDIVNWFDGVPYYYPSASSLNDLKTYTDYCENAVFKIAPNGDGIIMSSLSLAGGGTMVYPKDTWATSTKSVRADSPAAGLLWSAHLENISRAANGEAWVGAWTVNYNGTYWSAGYNTTLLYDADRPVSPWYYDSATLAGLYENFGWNSGSKPCPADAGSTDFHFYFENSEGRCVWYAPNTTASVSGYAYADEVYVPFAQLAGWPNLQTARITDCDFNREIIAGLVQSMWEVAHDQDPANTPPAPDTPIPAEEVQHCLGPPTVRRTLFADFGSYDNCGGATQAPETNPETPTGDGPSSPSNGDETPASWYDPPPTTNGSGFDLGDWSVSMPEWWPDLPTFDFTGATCPVYTLDLSGYWSEPFVVDSHCLLIEDYRVLLGILMLSVWTFSALLIVMRA